MQETRSGAVGRYAVYPSLRDRVVLITGGATGIGEELVRQFARQGARVAFLDIQDAPAVALSNELATAGCTAPLYVNCDLTDIAALRVAVQQVFSACGQVDVLVNNAGDDRRHAVEDVTPELFDQTIAVNLRPYFFMAQAVIPAMRAAGRGAIVNLSSICWMVPSTGMPVYVTAKAAIVGLTRTLAHEYGPEGVRVNALLPGGIVTEKQKRLVYTPEYKARILAGQALKRDVLPEDVARLVLFLAADDSSAITNQSYVIDGGWI
jgi:NAD(P)-dependent dehydrogenase (short-subunit alcohol dehydrogenase family)